jgi:hypothetical protein
VLAINPQAVGGTGSLAAGDDDLARRGLPRSGDMPAQRNRGALGGSVPEQRGQSFRGQRAAIGAVQRQQQVAFHGPEPSLMTAGTQGKRTENVELEHVDSAKFTGLYTSECSGLPRS